MTGQVGADIFPEREPMRLVCTSDIHTFLPNLVFPELPAGDILVIAGDLTNVGRITEVAAFGDWVVNVAAPQFKSGVVVVPGNHDFFFDPGYNLDTKMVKAVIDAWRNANVHTLIDAGVVLGGLNFWGSPWTPRFGEWAFMDEDHKLARYWDRIPEDTDVLVTHGPPYTRLDKTLQNVYAGSKTLFSAVERVKPKAHVFGHIHEAHGEYYGDTVFVNAAFCDRQYNPVQPAITVLV